MGLRNHLIRVLIVANLIIKEQGMRKDFYIFRHGETDLNKQKRWQGSGIDYDLNDEGQRQAAALAQRLADKNLQVIFSSPLLRALHTAEAVALINKIPVVVKDNLRECFYGAAEGRLIAELKEECPEILTNWYNPDPQYRGIRFKGGESKQEALERVLAEINKLKEEPYEIMGIAIHGGTMGQLLNYYHVPYDNIPNCAVLHLVLDEKGFHAEGGLF